jgi:antitoxin MazE
VQKYLSISKNRPVFRIIERYFVAHIQLILSQNAINLTIGSMLIHCNYQYGVSMTVKIISIGNSKGIRIPNNVLKSLKIGSEIDMVVNEDRGEVLLRPVKKTREGWNNAFKRMNEAGDDGLLVNGSNNFDNDDWKW